MSDLDAIYADADRERDRLFRRRDGRLEHLRTLELLTRLLPPPPARVLDVGGGPGTYAAWLVEQGYDAHLVEPAAALVAAAAARGAFPVTRGDARDLPEPSGSCDAVLLMGPLYHLRDPSHRHRALAEAVRVVRPGGTVIATALGRAAFAMYEAGRARDVDANREGWEAGLATGLHEPPLAFAPVHAHWPEELVDELEKAGLRDVRVFGVEGPAWTRFVADPHGPCDDADPELRAAVQLARLLEDEPSVRGTSAHLLAAGVARVR